MFNGYDDNNIKKQLMSEINQSNVFLFYMGKNYYRFLNMYMKLKTYLYVSLKYLVRVK